MGRYGKYSALQLLVSLLPLSGIVGADDKPIPNVPAEPEGVKTITSPSGTKIRYKEPGICETTPNVNSYSGYVDIDEDTHIFFWFFEARHDPANAPVTLWLNGGPGSDSLLGLFQELGPCNVTEDLKTQLNPYAWNEASNMLFISQPVGVGFSYSDTVLGSRDENTTQVRNETFDGVKGRFGITNKQDPIGTTDAAAVTVWDVVQAFYSALPQLDSDIKSRSFNLWTESYGGHYGPAFFKYFRDQNNLIANGSAKGVQLDFNTLGIINGVIDAEIQIPFFPEFAANNTYGINPLNDSMLDYMMFSLTRPSGCMEQISWCKACKRTDIIAYDICAEALAVCRSTVEGIWYDASGRGTYDIRHPTDDPTPPNHFMPYLNQSTIQNALGVNLNYTTPFDPYLWATFARTGDWLWPDFIQYLSELLDLPVRVALIYGDADYIVNWFGGEAVSLAVDYSKAEGFRGAGYAPFVAGDGKEYGVTREFGNFSFTRVYDAGHMVPYYQPLASLALFNRSITGMDMATGKVKIGADYRTQGPMTSNHTQPYVPLPGEDMEKRKKKKSAAGRVVVPFVGYGFGFGWASVGVILAGVVGVVGLGV
ncbi:hypothetical protein FQN51_006164 [Onygenales sp. PD_10]|nr:hypothetical protein FQN51_006164 [Onygenales sp. PD_10]